jgi:outer membrane immunogenic protein
MKNLTLGVFVAVAVFAAQLTLAGKADAQTPVNTWTGLYLGGNVGALRNRDTGTTSCITPTGTLNGTGCSIPTFGASTGTGGSAGGQIGYNWQFNRFVAGAEFDIQNSTEQGKSAFNGAIPCYGGGFAPNISYSTKNSITTLGTERLRVGFLASPKTLIYLTGGFAQGRANLQSVFVNNLTPATLYPLNVTLAENGTTEGLGVEWKTQPRMSVKAELLLVELHNATPYVFNAPGVTSGFQYGKDFEFHGALLRAGFNWKF